MSQEFDDALNDCLDRISNGETLQACLSDYPSYRVELGPLLQVAISTMEVAEVVIPSQQSKDRNFQRFMGAVQTAQTQTRGPRWYSFGWFSLARPIAISLAAFAVLVMGAGVSTAASTDSVPGEPLYWVKTTKESIQLRLPRSDSDRAQFHANLANVRGGEMRKLIIRGRYTAADGVMKRMNRHLGASAVYIGVDVTVNPLEMPRRHRPATQGRMVERLRSSLERDAQSLHNDTENMLAGLTSEQKQQIQHFMRQSEFFYQMLITAMNERADTGHLPFIRTMPPQGIMKGFGGQQRPPPGGQGGNPPPRPQDGGPPGNPPPGGPDLAKAASILGVTENTLRNALGPPPPDWAASAELLGITEQALWEALGVDQ